MANHKSALKRIRNSEAKATANRYQAKTMRNALKNFRLLKKQERSSSRTFRDLPPCWTVLPEERHSQEQGVQPEERVGHPHEPPELIVQRYS